MEDRVVINVENITKLYKLYNKPTDRIKEAIFPVGSRYYSKFWALNDISFKIKEKEIVGIIGKNGSGKSTLLKIISGVVTSTSGTIQVNGRVSALLELGAGFNLELSGIENIYFKGMVLGFSREEIDKKLEEIISFADIGEHIFQPVKTYSSGMFVRLSFALAVTIEPEILIIDEALSVGDVRFQQKAIRKMKELMDKARAILFVTHDMESVRNFCTRVLWIKDGKLYKDGDPKMITQWYYNYMIHDILPTDSIPQMSVQRSEPSNFDDGIEWDDVTDCDSTGNGGAEINKVAFYVKEPLKKVSILNGDEEKVVFFGKVEVKTDIMEPLIGFGIFDQRGVPVVHFNSHTIGEKLISLTKGDTVLLKYEFQLPKLRNGTYSIRIGIDDGTVNNNTVIIHLNECYIFKIARTDLVSQQYGLVIIEDASIKIL